MKVLIDRKGGTHYHKEGCRMTKEPRFTYGTVVTSEYMAEYCYSIVVDGRRYAPCPACFSRERKV